MYLTNIMMSNRSQTHRCIVGLHLYNIQKQAKVVYGIEVKAGTNRVADDVPFLDLGGYRGMLTLAPISLMVYAFLYM